MKKVFSLIMALLLVISTFAFMVGAEVGDYDYYEKESNNTYNSADKIYSDYTVNASLSGKYDIDFYTFTLDSSSMVSIYCQTSKNSIMLGIYDSSKNIISTGTAAYSDGYYYVYTNIILNSGTYYIGISQDTNYSLSYLLYLDYGLSSGSSSSSNSCDHIESEWQIESEPTCTIDGRRYKTCLICGKETNYQSLNATGHSESDWIVEKEATCTVNGRRYTKCKKCDATVREEVLKAPGHQLTDWQSEVAYASCGYEYNYYKACTVCEEIIETKPFVEPHIPDDEWIVESKVSCTEDGVKYIKCTRCKEILETEILPATGHDIIYLDAEEPTCDMPGCTEGEVCTICDAVIVEQKEIPPTGCINVIVTPGVEPTCTENGTTDTVYCLDCDMYVSEEEIIPATGHKEVTIKAKKATYTATGLTAGKKCSECGEVTVKQKKVAKKKLKKVTISSVKSTKAKQVNVSWKKVADATGFVVEYSTSKKFTKKTTKKVTIKKAKTLKTTLKKLKSGKKYYIRVRAYKTVGKKTVYGSYSAVKTVKVK